MYINLANYTDASLKIIQLAHQLTNDLGHSITGTEHIFLGILADQNCAPSKILRSMGITYRKAEEEAIRLLGREKRLNNHDYEFTPRAKSLINLAGEETARGDDPHRVEPEDMMIALLKLKRCTAQKIMHALDLDVDLILSRLHVQPRDTLTGNTTSDQLTELHRKVCAGEFFSEDKIEEESPDPMIGYIVDQKYEILEVIGRGGMGVVYKVRHLILDRFFAIKILHPYLASDVTNKRRFQREAQAASRLTHPNLATVFDWDLLPDGRPYLVMYYIEGIKLSDLIGCQDRIPLSIWMSIFIQTCDALAHAHNQGVIHRDLKPGNIILAREGDVTHFVKIVDFGIAKLLMDSKEGKDDKAQKKERELTKTGEVFGSPLYMSPEQCLGRTIDNRSDIYGLGCVIYEVLTNAPPFCGDSLYETMKSQISDPPAPISEQSVFDEKIPPDLEKLTLECLNKNPEDRPQSMEALRTMLSRINKIYYRKAEGEEDLS